MAHMPRVCDARGRCLTNVECLHTIYRATYITVHHAHLRARRLVESPEAGVTRYDLDHG